jgi:hypothetical protein
MECAECKKCNDLLKGLRMQNGKLKKQLEEGDKKPIPDLKPYISKVDRLKNLADNIGDGKLIEELGAELNNFKTIFKQLIRDVAV